MEQFHRIRDFWANRFASLSLFAFQTNLALAFQTRVPGFDELNWQYTPSGKVFASNLVVTCEGFYNKPHIDRDRTRYAFGMFGLIHRKTGEPYEKTSRNTLGDVKGATFRLDKFGIKVNLGSCNGMCEMVWDTRVSLFVESYHFSV